MIPRKLIRNAALEQRAAIHVGSEQGGEGQKWGGDAYQVGLDIVTLSVCREKKGNA